MIEYEAFPRAFLFISRPCLLYPSHLLLSRARVLRYPPYYFGTIGYHRLPEQFEFPSQSSLSGWGFHFYLHVSLHPVLPLYFSHPLLYLFHAFFLMFPLLFFLSPHPPRVIPNRKVARVQLYLGMFAMIMDTEAGEGGTGNIASGVELARSTFNFVGFSTGSTSVSPTSPRTYRSPFSYLYPTSIHPSTYLAGTPCRGGTFNFHDVLS